MDNKIIKSIKIYLRKKEKETILKKQKEYVTSIVKTILQDKTPKESIQIFKEIEKLFNEKLDDKLKESLETVKAITQYYEKKNTSNN